MVVQSRVFALPCICLSYLRVEACLKEATTSSKKLSHCLGYCLGQMCTFATPVVHEGSLHGFEGYPSQCIDGRFLRPDTRTPSIGAHSFYPVFDGQWFFF